MVGKKILIISEVFYPEDFLINDIAIDWQKRGNLVEVLTRNPSYPYGKVYSNYKNKWIQSEFYKGIKINRVKVLQGYRDNRFIKILNYFINSIVASFWALWHIKREYDYIFIHQTGPLTFASPGYLFARIRKIPTIIWTMDVWPDSVFSYGYCKKGLSRKILIFYVKSIYKRMSKVIVTSPGFIESLENFTSNKNIYVIPQWSRTVTKSSKVIKLQGSFNIVFTGNVGEAQNLEMILYAFERIKDEIEKKKVYFHIVGDGSSLKKLKSLQQNLLIPNVVFWGRRPLEEMGVFYEESDILLLPLKSDPIFNKVIPAKFQSYLAAGKPILGVCEGQISEYLEKYNLGWSVSPKSVDEIADSILKIICSSIDFEGYRKRTLSFYNLNYSKESVLKQFDLVIN